MAEPERIWVVDDDRAVRFVLATALRDAGFEVTAFAAAAEALDTLQRDIQARRGAPALVVTDVRMPGDSGLQLLEKLKAAKPDLPVIVMSAHTDVASTAGAAMYLTVVALSTAVDSLYAPSATDAGEIVTVDACAQVTRQLQYALEVDSVSYARLEVSSPGLDRPLRTEADYQRFAGQEVSLTLKLPFQGRKVWKGVLGRADEGGGWCLVLTERKPAGKPGTRPARKPVVAGPAGAAESAAQALGFTLDEVREARLVPVVDFKGRPSPDGGQVDAVAADRAATAVDERLGNR